MTRSKSIFPSYIIDGSIEGYLHRISRRRRTIYWLILALVLGVAISLPLVHVDVTVRVTGFFQLDVNQKVYPYRMWQQHTFSS